MRSRSGATANAGLCDHGSCVVRSFYRRDLCALGETLPISRLLYFCRLVSRFYSRCVFSRS